MNQPTPSDLIAGIISLWKIHPTTSARTVAKALVEDLETSGYHIVTADDGPVLPLTPYRVLVRKIAVETELPLSQCAVLAERCVVALRTAGHLPTDDDAPIASEAPVSPSAASTPPERVDDTQKPPAGTQGLVLRGWVNEWGTEFWAHEDHWSPWPAPASESDRYLGPESAYPPELWRDQFGAPIKHRQGSLKAFLDGIHPTP